MVLVFTAAIDEPRLEEAARTLLFVVVTFEATVARDAPSDDEAISVWALTAVVPEVTFAAVAREPAVNVASVKLRVPYVHTSEAVIATLVRERVLFAHTSAASVPKLVRERDPLAQTAVGMVAASEVEAVRTVESVWELMVEIAVVNCESV